MSKRLATILALASAGVVLLTPPTLHSSAALPGPLQAHLITVTNNGPSLDDQQVIFHLDTGAMVNGGTLRPDCADVRLVDPVRTVHAGGFIPHWRMDTCGGSDTRFMLVMAEIPSGTSHLVLLHGFAAWADESNPRPVAESYEDFETGTLGAWEETKTDQPNSPGCSAKYDPPAVVTEAGRTFVRQGPESVAGYSCRIGIAQPIGVSQHVRATAMGLVRAEASGSCAGNASVHGHNDTAVGFEPTQYVDLVILTCDSGWQAFGPVTLDEVVSAKSTVIWLGLSDWWSGGWKLVTSWDEVAVWKTPVIPLEVTIGPAIPPGQIA